MDNSDFCGLWLKMTIGAAIGFTFFTTRFRSWFITISAEISCVPHMMFANRFNLTNLAK